MIFHVMECFENSEVIENVQEKSILQLDAVGALRKT